MQQRSILRNCCYIAEQGCVIQVKELVQNERKSFLAVETIQGAANRLISDPERLLHRIVEHFQKLFSCPNMEGVIPAMNKAYMAVTESRNFLRSLSGILSLPDHSSSAMCLNGVRKLLDDNGRSLDLKDNYMSTLRGVAPLSYSVPSAANNSMPYAPC